MRLEEYISEAVSHGRKHKHKPAGKLTCLSTLDDFTTVLDSCGINRISKEEFKNMPRGRKSQCLDHAIKNWNYQYGVFDFSNGLTMLLVSPEKGKLFEFVWATVAARDTGYADARHYAVLGGVVHTVSQDDVPVEELDKLLHEGLF